MVKTRGNITFVRVFVLVTFFLTIVLDLRSETKEIFYVHSVTPPRNDRHRFLPKKTNFTPPLVLLTTEKKQEYSVLHQPQYTGYSKLCRQHFSYPSPALFSGFTLTGKIRGFHPINGPPDEMSSLSATENFKLNPKAIYQSPAGSCTRISNNFLPDVEKSPLLLAALNSSELVFYAPSGTKKKTPVHSSGGAPQLECPDDISTYTDINSCSSFIAGGLNPAFDETEVVTLTWEMFGATSDASPAQGINLIDDYTFDEGATIITYTATGTDGTTASCTFTVTISDNQVPRLESIPAGITVETAPGACAATVYWIEPTATDNCTAPHLLVKEATHYPGDEFPVGTTTVYYTAYDAMGNPSQTESFTITVKDTEPPVFSIPSDVTLACNDPLPAPWQTLQQLTAAGGSATDNCTIDAGSFRLLSETPSSTVCPYTLTRVYRIADAVGNITTAEHRIVVEGEGETVQPDQEEEVQLKSGMAEFTATQSGNWSDPATWGGVGPPTSTDNVTIPTGITVYVSDITIDGSLTLDDGASLEVTGNWTNNGTFTAETNSTVIFTGTTSPVSISGTNTTIFKNFELDKGAGNILNVNSDIELDGTITFTSGIMQISSGTSVICTHNAGFTIEEDAGVVISGGTFTTGPFSVENEGFIRIDSGALTFGTNSGNGVVIRNSGQLEINGGIVNVAGRLEVSGGTVDISDGTINLNTVGHSSATLGTLDLSLSSVWNMTGGTLNFENPSGAYDVVIKNSSGSKTFGGTINFGDGTSQTYKITSQVPFPGFNVASNTNIILEMLVSSDGTYNFPLVDGAGISIPASVTISGSGYTDASVQIETIGSKHDDNASSTNYLNRYWAITTSGITSPDYDVTVTYAPADIAGTESEIAAGLWTGSLPWGKGGVANSVNNSITFSGITAASADITGITLEPPTVEINNGNASETICNGSSITLNTTVIGDPTFNYSWDPTTDLDLTDPANPIADPSTTTTYEVTVTDGNGFTATDNITVTVNPIPDVTATPASETICSGTATNIALSGSVDGTTFNWTVVQSGVTGATNGSGSTIAQTLSTTGTSPGTVTYTVTPTANGCTGSPIDVEVTVNPVPVVDDPADQEICAGESTTAITFTGTATSFNWTNDNTSIGLPASGTGNIASFSATNPGNTTQVANITVTPVYSNNGVDCNGTAETFSITVNPIPTVSATPATQQICPGGTITPIVITNLNNVAETTFAWTRDNTTTLTGLESGAGNTISGIINSSNPGVLETTTFTITATANGCSSQTTVEVVVGDNIAPTISNCPANISINTDEANPNCNQTTTWTTPTASDNCSGINLSSTHSSGDVFSVGLTTVTYTATDASGNTSTCSFTVTVNDNTAPVITRPADITVQCGSSIDPSVTGNATASDACSGEIISPDLWYVDDTPGTGCSYDIARTWYARDGNGNVATAIQTISVEDSEDPVVTSINHMEVNCPADIPLPDETAITATDNCGTVNIIFWDERAIGLSDKPGYCPTAMEYDYLVSDGCGNSVIATQVITVLGLSSCWESGTCEACSPSPGNDDLYSFFTVDLRGDPDANVFFESVYRQDKCCNAKKQEYCASFNVILDEDAVGVEVQITNPAPPGQAWDLNCGEAYVLDGGSVVCLPGGEFNLFTYCAAGEGENRYNDWRFISYSGVVIEKEIDTRVECNTQITAEGVYANPVWNSVFPGAVGEYNDYLYAPGSDIPGSGVNVPNPIFIAPLGEVGQYQFELCAETDVETICAEETTGKDCDIVTINVIDAINIDLKINPDLMCADDLPFVLTPEITPLNANYKIEWFTGYDADPVNKFGEGATSPQITAEGQYSIKVTDMQEGIECSTEIFNFDTEVDRTGPTDFVAPDQLVLSCDDSEWQNKINNWLESATATYIDANGDVQPAYISNDFSFAEFDLSCHEHPVNFIAEDQCQNPTPVTSSILVYDDIPPSITCPPAADNIPADENLCQVTTLILDTPVATDNCDTEVDITWKKTGATTGLGTGTAPGPFNVGETIIIYTATDDCGNSSTCNQRVTVMDITPPNLTLGCEDVVEEAALNNCSKIPATMNDPTYSDDCWPTEELTLTWVMTGATVGSGTGSAAGQTYNVGVTTVVYTVTDPHGNSKTCEFTVTIVDVTPPNISIAGCENVAEIAGSNDCYIIPATIEEPVYSDDCWEFEYLTLTWGMTGATTGTGTGSVVSESFNIGVTTVIYTVTDPDGNEATCSFDVTILHDEVPDPAYDCPTAYHEFDVDPATCVADVTLDAMIIYDPCNEIDSYWNDSPYRTSQTDASGIYPAGTTTFNWYITDISGNTASCQVTVVVNDNIEPTIDCPPNIVEYADEYENFASNISPANPTIADNCNPGDLSLAWVLVPPTGFETEYEVGELSGTGIYPASNSFFLGVTTITYTVTDLEGNSVSCSFTVTILAAPVIECPPDTTVYANENCVHPFNPGVPTLLEGAQPITWTYTINGNSPVPFVGSVGDPGPPDIGEYDFPLGETIITWRAENMAGFDECQQFITVIDTMAPTYVPPPSPFEDCVDPLHWAVYNPSAPNPVVNHTDPLLEKYPSPDFHTLTAGSTDLDLDMSNYADNCCAVDDTWSLRWQIDFVDVPDPLVEGATISHGPITGNGQPSTYVNPVTGNPVDIYLWGDGVYFTTKIHTITYWITDCNGNESQEIVKEIRITPRPQITKENY